MIVQLIESDPRYPDLTPGKPYAVIGIEADDYRLINDRGQPFLYPADVFELVDASRPSHWIVERGEEGEEYAYPEPLNRNGFFEDFFDGNPQAVGQFWHVMNAALSRRSA